MANSPLQPTFQWYISNTLDAAIVFKACLSGRLNHVPRRPYDRERQDPIKSGNVFIYEEHASGIKHWIDSVSWSPSRILGNCLRYQELEKPFPPGEKKRALERSRKLQQAGVSKQQEQRPRASISFPTGLEQNGNGNAMIDDVERALSGRLVTPNNYPLLRTIVPRSEPGWRSIPFPSTQPLVEWMDVHLGPPGMEWMEMDAKSGPVEWMDVEMEMRGRYKVPGTFTSSRSLSVLLI
ncbi:hypothetical protein ACKLNR_014677 [Fusarium oxysporum f. sp. zingiberi]